MTVLEAALVVTSNNRDADMRAIRAGQESPAYVRTLEERLVATAEALQSRNATIDGLQKRLAIMWNNRETYACEQAGIATKAAIRDRDHWQTVALNLRAELDRCQNAASQALETLDSLIG